MQHWYICQLLVSTLELDWLIVLLSFMNKCNHVHTFLSNTNILKLFSLWMHMWLFLVKRGHFHYYWCRTTNEYATKQFSKRMLASYSTQSKKGTVHYIMDFFL
jgi:hypothetical protein